jgi:hypothetical protein
MYNEIKTKYATLSEQFQYQIEKIDVKGKAHIHGGTLSCLDG